MNLIEIENELKKRLNYQYKWGKKQNNEYDSLTNFIYNTFNFDTLLNKINTKFIGKPDYNDLFNYTLNRWFNFWSSQAVEKIFCSLPDVKPALDNTDRFVDFNIQGIDFDHKTSVFPAAYHGSLAKAQNNPGDLIEWLYKNQSQQQRKHFKNRLFIVLYSPDKQHWKLKADVMWLKNLIQNYINSFNKDILLKFSFEPDSITLSDIIWAIK